MSNSNKELSELDKLLLAQFKDACAKGKEPSASMLSAAAKYLKDMGYQPSITPEEASQETIDELYSELPDQENIIQLRMDVMDV